MTLKKIKIFVAFLLLLGIIQYCRLPDYKVLCSNKVGFDSYSECTLSVVVYRAHYNRILYEMIAEEHNKINEKCNKLTVKLYYSAKGFKKGKKPYRVVVFDYDNDLRYILI